MCCCSQQPAREAEARSSLPEIDVDVAAQKSEGTRTNTYKPMYSLKSPPHHDLLPARGVTTGISSTGNHLQSPKVCQRLPHGPDNAFLRVGSILTFLSTVARAPTGGVVLHAPLPFTGRLVTGRRAPHVGCTLASASESTASSSDRLLLLGYMGCEPRATPHLMGVVLVGNATILHIEAIHTGDTLMCSQSSQSQSPVRNSSQLGRGRAFDCEGSHMAGLLDDSVSQMKTT